MPLGQWIGLLTIIASLYILWQIRQALLLLFTAIVLATALNRLARKFQQWLKITRSRSILMAISIFILIVIIFFLLIVPPFVSQFNQLIQQVPLGIEKLNHWLVELDKFVNLRFGKSVPNLMRPEELLQQIQPFLNSIVGRAGVFVGTTLGAVFSFWFLLIFTVMLLADPQSYRKAFLQIFPSFYRRRIDDILDQCEIALGRWVIGALISMSVVAGLSWLGLSVLGVRLALANAIIAGLLNFIPNLGPTLSIFPPMAIALLDSPLKSGLVLGLYIVIQQFEGNILTPYVMAQQVALLPAITLIAQVLFATCFGFWGLLLALPLTVVAQVFLQEILIKDILDPWQDREGENQAIGLDELGLQNTQEPQISESLPPKEDSENANTNPAQVTEKSSEKPDDNQP